MIANGFGDYIPKFIDFNNLTYPLVLKGTVSLGSSHVYIVDIKEQLDERVNILINEKKDILMEEALTEMGLMEGDVLASAFRGEIVSMDYQITTFYNDDLDATKLGKVYVRKPWRFPK